MKPENRPCKFIGIVAVLTLTACATSPKMKNYSRTALDRPFTLPEGGSETVFNPTLGYQKTILHYDPIQPIPLSIIWSHAVSDDFSFL